MTINIKWSEEDRQTLRDMFAAGSSFAEIGTALGRTPQSVTGYAYYLGLRRPRVKQERAPNTTRQFRVWTQEEDDYVKANYGKNSVMDIANHLGRSGESVCNRARRLGVANYSKRPNHRPLGAERVNNGKIERKVANTGDIKTDWRRIEVLEWEQVHGAVPDGMLLVKARGKSRTAENMQLVPISEFPLLASNLGPKDVRKLQSLKAKFSFTLSKIEKLQNAQDETIRLSGNGLTVSEAKYLSKNYESLSIAEMASSMGRPAYSVRGFLLRMGLLKSKEKERFSWNEENLALLISSHHHCSNPELAKLLGCSLYVVKRKRKKLGILDRQKVKSP